MMRDDELRDDLAAWVRLVFRNTGTASCSLEGWPAVAIRKPGKLRARCVYAPTAASKCPRSIQDTGPSLAPTPAPAVTHGASQPPPMPPVCDPASLQAAVVSAVSQRAAQSSSFACAPPQAARAR